MVNFSDLGSAVAGHDARLLTANDRAMSQRARRSDHALSETEQMSKTKMSAQIRYASNKSAALIAAGCRTKWVEITLASRWTFPLHN
jgi:hypothetical protein